MAGTVYEVQKVRISAATDSSTWSGGVSLKLGSSGEASVLLSGSSQDTVVADALNGLLDSNGGVIAGLHVTRSDFSDDVSQGYDFHITFTADFGDVELLQVDTSTLDDGSGGNVDVMITEFVEGVANRFTIEPKKASGAVVKDLTAAANMAGGDIFYTELWTSDTSVVDGTHTWSSDGGLAVYNPVQYDIQTIETTVMSPSTISSGTFQLVFDTQRSSGGYLDGTRSVTAAIAYDADAKAFKDALELLSNVDTVDVEETVADSDGTKMWTVTFKTNLGAVPLLALETGHSLGGNAGVQITRTNVGVAEIQTISTAASSAFTREEQTFSIHGTGSFTITFDNAAPATLDTNDLTVSSVQAAIDSLDTVGLATVSAGADATTFVVEFFDPVGDLAKLQIDSSALAGCSGDCHDVVETIQGFSPLGGTFVVSFLDEYTDNLDFDATEDEMKFELEKLSTVGKVDVMREDLGNGHRWTVTFLENLGNIPMMIAHPIRQEVQYVESYGGTPTPLEGSFKLSFAGEMSADIPFDAEAEVLKASLEALSTVGIVTVNRDGPLGGDGFGRYRWRVTFRSDVGSLENMVVDYSGMSGTDARVEVTTHQIGSC